MIKNLIFVILFSKHFFRVYNLSPHVSMDVIRVLFIPEFVAENLKANKNQPKRYFTKLNCFEIENKMLPKHSQRAFWAYKFSSKHVTVWCQEKYLHCTISWRPRSTFLKHFKSKCLYISVYLSFCFKDEVRFYLVVWGGGGGGVGGDWIISLRRLTV